MSQNNYDNHTHRIEMWRFSSMRATAKASGKYVPTNEELWALLKSQGTACYHCKQELVWSRREHPSLFRTLQHDRDGTLRYLCNVCNLKHKAFPGDTFYQLDPEFRYCKKCATVKPISEFYKGRLARDTDNSRLGSGCKLCKDKEIKAWCDKNTEKRKLYSQKAAEKRKLQRHEAKRLRQQLQSTI